MKTSTLCLVLSICSFAALGAETNRVDLEATLPPAPPPKTPLLYQSSQPLKTRRWNFTYNGVLPQIRKASNPLQLINPFAPMSYGDGYANVTREPYRQRIDGWVLLRIGY